MNMSLDLNENAEKITATLYYFDNNTQAWLEENIEWLKFVSRYGISLYLERAEALGYIESKCIDEVKGTLQYQITVKGRVVAESRTGNKEEMLLFHGDQIKEIVRRAESELAIIVQKPVRLQVHITDPLNMGLKYKIQDAITAVCDVTLSQMLSTSRKREIVLARHLYFFFMCFYTNLSLKSIGESMGDRDHTTVIHARESIKDKLEVKDETVTKAHKMILDVLELEDLKILKLLRNDAA